MTSMRVEADAVVVDRGDVRIVSNGVLCAEPGTVVGLVGPNGSGKSTLLRTVYGAIRPTSGVVRVGGDDVTRLSARELARRTAVVTQDNAVDFDFTGREIVALGRTPHKRLVDRHSSRDDDVIDEAIARVAASGFADRPFATLSGGERQRLLVARALAQEPRVIVLDEPTNHLDIAAQLDLMALVSSLPATVVVALHDLNLAVAHCDDLFVVDDGRVVAHGPPDAVLTPELVQQIFGVAAWATHNPLTGRPALLYGPPLTAAPSPQTEETIR